MKKRFTLVFISLLSTCLSALAVGPAVPASNLVFTASQLDGNRFGFSFRKGDGAFRIIVVKAGSPITTAPVNGTDYTYAAQYGTPGSEFNGNDGYVNFRGSHTQTNPSLSVTNLDPGTTYYVSIWEFNGSGAATEYLATALTGNITTKSAPAQQAVIASFTNVAGNRLTVNWTGGNGERTLLLARKGAPVNATPEQLEDYISSGSFGSGNAINSDNYVVYEGSGSAANITSLEPNTTYHFAVFEYNGDNAPVYLVPGNVHQCTTNTGPTQASGNINFINIEGNRLTLSFAIGNGKHQLIIGRKGQPVTAVPQNGQTYAANTVYGSGYQFPTGDFVLNSTNNDRTFTNLDPSSTYYFRVYDFDVDGAGNTYYLTSSWSEKSGNTAFPPTTQPSDIEFTNVTGTTVSLEYTRGTSAYRLIVMKAASPVDAIPADLTRYTGNPAFGSGSQITPGNYVIYGQTNSHAATISGLTPGVTYHMAIWGFNGNNFPVYGTPPATASITIPNEPATPGNTFLTNTIEGNTFRIQWSGGDGARRLVIGRKGAPVSAAPVDGEAYTADNSFEHGQMIAADEYVVYDGTSRVVTIENLEPASTFHFEVFEYNIAGGVPDYLVSQSLSGSGSTVSPPTQGPGVFSATDVQDLQAKINFTAGDGSSRLFIMRAGSPVDAEPEDLISYTASGVYGSREIGTGNYIVQKTSGSASFTVTGLIPNTRYYVTAFEFNGSGAPVYLRPGNSFDFETTGSGTPPPTTHATNPSFSIVDGNKLTFNWNEGDGEKRIVVMKQGSAVTFTPTDGAEYTANVEFGLGTDLGDGQFVVYNATQESVTITNLQPATNYHFAVFEYNGTGTNTRYLSDGHLAVQQSTATMPAAGSSNATGIPNALTIALSWTSGPGAARMVVMKEGAAVSGTPVNLSKYPANAAFGAGSQIAAGEYVVYAGSANGVTVTGLEAGKTYHFALFEYNGVDAPLYNTADIATGSATISGTLPLRWLSVNASEVNDVVRLNWSTADEVHTSHFVVERSVNSSEFVAIGTVTAKGGAIRNDYSFEDGSLPLGTVIYRIRQVDIDNNYEYSILVVIQNKERRGSIRLSPNPASNATRITLPWNVQQATLRIYTISGILVKTVVVANQQTISVQELPKGMYQVVVSGQSGSWNERLIIQ